MKLISKAFSSGGCGACREKRKDSAFGNWLLRLQRPHLPSPFSLTSRFLFISQAIFLVSNPKWAWMLLSFLEGALAPVIASVPPFATWDVGAITGEGLRLS